MTRSPRPVDWSVKIYDALLRAYPSSFRKDYGDEMTLAFRELANDAWDRGGWMGLAGVWLRVFVDLARTLPQEHYLTCQEALRLKTASPVKTTALVCISIASGLTLNLALFAVLDIGILLAAWLYESFHYQNWPPSHVLLTLLPPFFTGVIASRARWFYRPYLIAPLGPMMIAAASSSSNPRAPCLTSIGYPLLVVAATLMGCYAASKVLRRTDPACTAHS